MNEHVIIAITNFGKIVLTILLKAETGALVVECPVWFF
jgi:hypothetical protein